MVSSVHVKVVTLPTSFQKRKDPEWLEDFADKQEGSSGQH